jgi:hypothetical protein
VKNLNWKFDWKEITLNGLHLIDQILWSILCMLGGAWAVTQDPEALALLNQHGEQILTTWLIIWFVVSLADTGLERWLNRKEAAHEPV